MKILATIFANVMPLLSNTYVLRMAFPSMSKSSNRTVRVAMAAYRASMHGMSTTFTSRRDHTGRVTVITCCWNGFFLDELTTANADALTNTRFTASRFFHDSPLRISMAKSWRVAVSVRITADAARMNGVAAFITYRRDNSFCI